MGPRLCLIPALICILFAASGEVQGANIAAVNKYFKVDGISVYLRRRSYLIDYAESVTRCASKENKGRPVLKIETQAFFEALIATIKGKKNAFNAFPVFVDARTKQPPGSTITIADFDATGQNCVQLVTSGSNKNQKAQNSHFEVKSCDDQVNGAICGPPPSNTTTAAPPPPGPLGNEPGPNLQEVDIDFILQTEPPAP